MTAIMQMKEHGISGDLDQKLKKIKLRFIALVSLINFLTCVSVFLLSFFSVEPVKRIAVSFTLIIIIILTVTGLFVSLMVFIRKVSSIFRTNESVQPQTIALYDKKANGLVIKQSFLFFLLPVLYALSTVILGRPTTYGILLMLIFGGTGIGFISGSMQYLLFKSVLFNVLRCRNYFIKNDSIRYKIMYPAFAFAVLMVILVALYSYSQLIFHFSQNKLSKELYEFKYRFTGEMKITADDDGYRILLSQNQFKNKYVFFLDSDGVFIKSAFPTLEGKNFRSIPRSARKERGF
ncbi:hypothetical protein KJ966_31685, partial [bacterium]|nr:hypothetical protein [bacterium]